MGVNYTEGALVLETVFKVGATPTDPSAVTLTVRNPAGTVTTYTYGDIDAVIVRLSAGRYEAAIPVGTLDGVWGWKWKGTGTALGSDQDTFVVEPSTIVRPGLCALEDITRAKPDAAAGGRDDLYRALIARASEVLEDFTGRQFMIDSAPSARVFPMSTIGEREVLIDDLSTTPTALRVIDADFETVETLNLSASPAVYRSLPLNRRVGREPITSIFLTREAPVAATYLLEVTGVWGWPRVPERMREACIETVADWVKNYQGLSNPSPNQWSAGDFPQRMLPMKARDLARHYRRGFAR